MTSKTGSGRGGRHDPTMTSRSKASRRFGVEPASIKALHAQTGLSQAKFAGLLGVGAISLTRMCFATSR